MKIYLTDDKIWRINQDSLKSDSLKKHIKQINKFNRVFSDESILKIRDNKIYKLLISDMPIENGKIIHYSDHDYYQNNSDDNKELQEIIDEYNVFVDKSSISYKEVYRIPPKHISETVLEYVFKLHAKSNVKMILEIIDDKPHDLYFNIPDNMNIQDSCSQILNLFQLVKI